MHFNVFIDHKLERNYLCFRGNCFLLKFKDISLLLFRLQTRQNQYFGHSILGKKNSHVWKSWSKANSKEAKENEELFEMSNEFRLSTEFRSEEGKMAHSVHICPRLKRVDRQQSHISVKKLNLISSLKVYSSSNPLAMVNNKSKLYSSTWNSGEMSYLIYTSTLNFYLN